MRFLPILLFLSFCALTFAQIEQLDADPLAADIITVSTVNTALPSVSTWAFYYDLKHTLSASNTKRYMFPSDPTKATVAIVPTQTLSTSVWGSSPALVNPVITFPDNAALQSASLPTTNSLVEGHIYHVTPPSTTNIIDTTTTFHILWPQRKPTIAVEYFIILYGCVIDTANPTLTECSGDDVRQILSIWIQIPAGTQTTAVLSPIKANANYLASLTCGLEPLIRSGKSFLPNTIGQNVVPTGSKFECGFLFNPPSRLDAVNTYALAVQIVKIGSYTPSVYQYGHSYPQVVNIQEVSRSSLLSRTTGTIEFMNQVDVTDNSFSFTPFDPYAEYGIRFRLQDSTTIASLTLYNIHFFADAFYYKSQGPLVLDLAPPLKIISDCSLYSQCLTQTVTPTYCLTQSHLTTYRSIDLFRCDCNPVFGGVFCEYSWLQDVCPLSGESERYSCFLRSGQSHVRDHSWALLNSVEGCLSITPPENTSCHVENQLIACSQSNPLPLITSTTPPDEYNRIALGSQIQCAPLNINLFKSFNNIEYTVYVIWDINQATINVGRDQLVTKQIYPYQQIYTLELTDSTWFTPPTSALATNPNVSSADARFYITMRPITTDPGVPTYYSPIYPVTSACEYYDSICQAADNYIQCKDLSSAPFISIADLTQDSCDCRSGFVLTYYRDPNPTVDIDGLIKDNSGYFCTVFNISNDCPAGAVSLDGCCASNPLVPEVKTQCRDNFLTDQPRFTAVELSHINDLSVFRNSDVVLNPGDKIRLRWGTIGSIHNADKTSLVADIYLFTPPPQVDYAQYILPNRFDDDGNMIEISIDEIIRNNFYNDGDQYRFSIQSQNTASTLAADQPPSYPLFLAQTQVDLGEASFTLPNLALHYNSVLVMVFQTTSTATSAPRYVVGHSKTQFFHTHPQCSSLSLQTDDNTEKTHSLNPINRCTHGECDLILGQCQCADLYNKYILFAPAPNFCQMDVCSGYLTCANGVCDSSTFKCTCAEGWTGEYCDIAIGCNPAFASPTSPTDGSDSDPMILQQFETKDILPTADPNQCGNGFVEQDWLTFECGTECICLPGYSGAPACNTCQLQCSRGGSPQEDCTSCDCNRYTDGLSCVCDRLPVLISLLYNTIDSSSDLITSDGSVAIDAQDVLMNNEIRGLLSSLITDYYYSVDQIALTVPTGQIPTIDQITAATGIYVSAIGDNQVMFNITNSHALVYFVDLLQQELYLPESDFRLDYITATVLTDQFDPTTYIPFFSAPTQYQLVSLTLSLFIHDDCNQAQTTTKLATNTLTIFRFIHNIRQNTTKFPHLWGSYRELIQYIHEAKLEDSIEQTKSFIIEPSRGYIFNPILPQSMTALRQLNQLADDNLPLLRSNTVTMIQFDPILYNCASGNVIPASTSRGSFNQDVIYNKDNDKINTISTADFTLDIDSTCFSSYTSASLMIDLIGVFIMAFLAINFMM